MKVGIIGAGNVGTALATSITKAGHEVSISSRDPQHAAAAAAASGAQVAATNADAARHADVVILAVYAESVPDIADEIGDVIDGKVVVDVTNRMSFGPNGPEIDTTSSNAEAIAEAFPTARVVKAFNTLLAGRQVDPVADGIRLDGFVAGDDAAAKAAVIELVRGMGLDPIDVGPLVRARQLEALAFLNIALNVQNGGSWQSAWKLVDAPRAVAPAA
jgi:8-hydroxy-5-deazaflavin:NADPH oxidoreductase